MPSAVDPVSVQRQVSAALTLLRRDVVAALVRREVARVWLRWRQGPGACRQGSRYVSRVTCGERKRVRSADSTTAHDDRRGTSMRVRYKKHLVPVPNRPARARRQDGLHSIALFVQPLDSQTRSVRATRYPHKSCASSTPKTQPSGLLVLHDDGLLDAYLSRGLVGSAEDG